MDETNVLIIPDSEMQQTLAGKINIEETIEAKPCDCSSCGSCRCTPCKCSRGTPAKANE